MRSISEYITERKIEESDISWLTIELIQDALPLFDECGSLCALEYDSKYKNIDSRNLKILEALLAWIKYGDQSIRSSFLTPEDIYKYIKTINKSRLDKFIGRGSEGIIFDAGKYIIKIFACHPTVMSIVKSYLIPWCNYKKELETIPSIIKYDKDYRWIMMEKVTCPCLEGEWIGRSMKYCWSCDDIEDNPETNERTKKYIESVPKRESEFVISWVRQYMEDYMKILPNEDSVSDDLKSLNIGKTKDGRVVCFDWNSLVL